MILVPVADILMEAHALSNARMNKRRRIVKPGRHLLNAAKTMPELGTANVSKKYIIIRGGKLDVFISSNYFFANNLSGIAVTNQ